MKTTYIANGQGAGTTSSTYPRVSVDVGKSPSAVTRKGKTARDER